MSEAPQQRPARKQVEAPVTGQEETREAGTFNIWTGRTLKGYGGRPRGEGGAPRGPRKASEYRCRPKLDAGRTRGDAQGVAYCCLYFARGLCHHGADCTFLHRVPTAADEARHVGDYANDIFGRERRPEHQDGRKRGVGSYERECRTLYVGYGGAGALPAAEVKRLIGVNFSEWGPVDDVHVVPDKAIAFVRYRWRSSAEFAKAAMHQQGLTGSTAHEVLDVRWANDDPNPSAVRRVARQREESLRDAFMQAVETMDPDAKRARLAQLHLASTLRPGPVAAYPDTDAQYGGTAGQRAAAPQYRHSYEGWDAFHYAQAQRAQQQGSAGGDGDGPADAAAYEAWAEGGGQPYPVPGTIPADDISRYLPPEELAPAWQQQYAAARPDGAAAGAAGTSGAAGDRQDEQQHEQVAQEALAVLAGYGSGSDDGDQADTQQPAAEQPG